MSTVYGLSVPSNQELLRGLLGRPRSGPRAPQKTADYLLRRLEEGSVSVERSEAIFHCLSELKERRLVEQMQHVLTSGRPVGEGMSQSQWAALVFLLLTSHRQDVFELKKLAGCYLTQDGCLSLVSALTSVQNQLSLLDLSRNHPGASAVLQLSGLQGAPHSPLQTLILRPAGAQWLRPKIRYFTRLTMDPDTAYRHLRLSRDLTQALHVQQDHDYADGNARFDKCPQLLCAQELYERSYWELEWTGKVTVGLCYPSLTRKGNTSVCGFGTGPDSWGLTCTQGGFAVTHQGKHTLLGFSASSRGRVAVFVDVPAGLLEFYAVTQDQDEPVLLHTFRADFAQPLVPGLQLLFGSSVKLCDLEQEEPDYLQGL
uniref:B30.2/SPRY domain-containing protein n=1 Tax=Knipowitschia caucasica TaxID=637954 RepID=A0AAV2L7X0_KNICA